MNIFIPFHIAPSQATALRWRNIYRFKFKSRTTQRFSPVKSRVLVKKSWLEIVLKLRLNFRMARNAFQVFCHLIYKQFAICFDSESE